MLNKNHKYIFLLILIILKPISGSDYNLYLDLFENLNNFEFKENNKNKYLDFIEKYQKNPEKFEDFYENYFIAFNACLKPTINYNVYRKKFKIKYSKNPLINNLIEEESMLYPPIEISTDGFSFFHVEEITTYIDPNNNCAHTNVQNKKDKVRLSKIMAGIKEKHGIKEIILPETECNKPFLKLNQNAKPSFFKNKNPQWQYLLKNYNNTLNKMQESSNKAYKNQLKNLENQLFNTPLASLHSFGPELSKK